ILLLLVLADLAPRAALAEPRRLTLDDVIKIARDGNRDLAAAREHLKQVALDIDRARAVLLPTAALQGKYTINYPEVSLNFADAFKPGPHQLAGIELQTQNEVVQSQQIQ